MKGCVIGIITGLGSLIIDASVLTNLNILESICVILAIMIIWGYFGFIIDFIIETTRK